MVGTLGAVDRLIIQCETKAPPARSKDEMANRGAKTFQRGMLGLVFVLRVDE